MSNLLRILYNSYVFSVFTIMILLCSYHLVNCSLDPEIKDTLSVRRLCNTVTVDWSNVFHLNGLLKNFEFLVNSLSVDFTTAVTRTVEDLQYGARKSFIVVVFTQVDFDTNTITILITLSDF